jgi:Type II secretory pathway, ATPase PulE/Tfp pilus assembly pathway, ATPase PilB
MTIEDFITVPEILSIFRDAAITDCERAVFCLEQYQFVTRSSIVGVLSDLSKDPVLEVSSVSGPPELVEFGRKYNVLIEQTLGKDITVYYSFFDAICKERLELDLDRYNVNYIALTPYNFMALQDPDLNGLKWDAEIMFKRILLEAVRLEATDLHFSVEHVNMYAGYPVMYRKNGNLYRMNLFELTPDLNHRIVSSLIENKTNANSLDLGTSAGVTAVCNDPLSNGRLELRISANRVEDGWHCVIRIQKKETFNFSIRQLGFSEDIQNALYKMTKKRSGIVFITGAIRTGKNTTAFAMANEMTNQPIKIISYEYPIEVLMPFPQVNYKGDNDMLLNNIRLAKKQDINVAFINEIPNKEVAFAVQDLVNSSVYVITTMHVDRLWHLPYKLKDYYGEGYKDVISQINAVFNQKMFSVPCRNCQDRKLISDLGYEKEKVLRERNIETFFDSRGCDCCNGTGIQDGKNQPYVEYLIFSSEIKSKLLACNEPYEMEGILKEAVTHSRQSLEDYMSLAVQDGSLDADALDSIV